MKDGDLSLIRSAFADAIRARVGREFSNVDPKHFPRALAPSRERYFEEVSEKGANKKAEKVRGWWQALGTSDATELLGLLYPPAYD